MYIQSHVVFSSANHVFFCEQRVTILYSNSAFNGRPNCWRTNYAGTAVSSYCCCCCCFSSCCCYFVAFESLSFPPPWEGDHRLNRHGRDLSRRSHLCRPCKRKSRDHNQPRGKSKQMATRFFTYLHRNLRGHQACQGCIRRRRSGSTNAFLLRLRC